MSLRITHNADAAMVLRNLSLSSSRLTESQKRLASGLRVKTAADDSAALTISEKMRAQIRGLEVANRNVQDGMAVLSVLEGALGEIHSILHRARDLATQWNQGTLSFEDKDAIRTELFSLSNEVARIAEDTKWNGQRLFDENRTLTLQVGENAGDQIIISMVDAFGAGATSLVRPSTFFALPWLDADVAGFNAHIDDVSQARAQFGAISNRLSHISSANELRQQNLMKADARIRDVDAAREIATIARQQILQETGAAMLAFANQSPRRVLDLLYGQR